MTQIGPTAVVALTAIAAVLDVRERRIPNALTYPGIVGGLVISAVGAGFAPGGNWWERLEFSLQGLLVCGAIMLLCFVFLGIGGGDVKLMAMIGAFVGWERGLEVLLWSVVLAAGWGLVRLIWLRGAWQLLKDAACAAWFWLRTRQAPPRDDVQRRQMQMAIHLAPATLVALLIVLATPLR
ncbi:MAG: prepilin peptidase [Planctomycetota bacterium]|nr:MAG: prepilin peptidase [Planctomycetota bacterium]